MTPRIVLLDPEPLTETTISRALRLAGFHVTVVADELSAGLHALAHGADVIVITDPPGRCAAESLSALAIPVLMLDPQAYERMHACVAGDPSHIVARVRSMLATHPCNAA